VGINDKNNLNNTAIMIAAERGHLDIVKELLGRKADLTLKNVYGQTSIILATENDHVNVVKYICEATGDLNILRERNKYDKSPILVAAEFGKENVARYIIQRDVTQIFAKTFRGISVLHFACTGKSDAHTAIVNMVLDAAEKLSGNADIRADLDAKMYCTKGNLWDVLTSFDDTPLIWAAISGKIEHVKLLLMRESEWINNKDKATDPPKSSLNVQNKQGYSALMKAAEQGYDEIVRYLLDRGADPTLTTKINNRDFDARKLAWSHAHVGVANIFFELDHKNGKTTKISDIFDEEELNKLGGIFGNHIYFDSLRKIVELATVRDFYLELFLSLIPKIEGVSPSLVSKINSFVFTHTIIIFFRR